MSGLATHTVFDQGVSDEAKQLRKQLTPANDSIAATYTGLLWDLFEAARESASPGWDGYSAKPVTHGAVRKAEAFLSALQRTWPRPQILIDPDGEIWIQWHRHPARTFAVAVGESENIHYAGLFGASRSHGAEMLNERLLGVVSESLERLYPDTIPPEP